MKKLRYNITCSKCNLDNTHETDLDIEYIKQYWKKWNKIHGKNMKCVHEYQFRILDSRFV